MPLSFSVTKISLGPKKCMLVGYLNPLNTASTSKVGSFMIGPLGDGRPASGYFESSAYARSLL